MSKSPQASWAVLLEVQDRGWGKVAFVTVDNSARANALCSALMETLAATLEDLVATPGLAAVVLTGAGERCFIAGADIGEMASFPDSRAARAFILRVHRCCEALRALPVPVIARINGAVLGAGLEIAAACDVRAAADHAWFGMPEVRLGVPSVVEAALLPQLIGWGRTRELLLFGETFTAEEVSRWGLVERVVGASGLDDVIESWLDQLSRCAPNAVRLQKKLMRAWEDLPLRAAIAAGVDAFEAAAEGPEPAREMGAYLAARRKAKSGGEG